MYPATYNLLEIPAVLKPQVRLYATGIIRISRHPQAVGQILWCLSHALWIGSSFMLVTCVGLIGHHLFAVWHGDRRQRGSVRRGLSKACDRKPRSFHSWRLLDGRQQLILKELVQASSAGNRHCRGCVLVGASLHPGRRDGNSCIPVLEKSC